MTAQFAGWRTVVDSIDRLVTALEYSETLTTAEEAELATDIAGLAAGLVGAGRSHAERLGEQIAALNELVEANTPGGQR